MNRRKIMKLLGLGLVAPGALLKILRAAKPEGGILIPSHLQPAMRALLDELDAKGMVTMWQPGERTITNFDNPKNWSNGVPRDGVTMVFHT